MQAAVLDPEFDSDWCGDAVATIIALTQAQPLVTSDDLRKEMRPPHHPSQFGAAFSAARKLGYVEPVGYRTSTALSRHHGVLRTWRRKITEGVAAA